MFVVLVYSHVKLEFIEQFKQASLDNASQSKKEPGIARFDVIQQIDDPGRFVLIEVYRTQEALASHRETSHYQKWREVVESMLAESRSRNQYTNVYPDDKGWG